jgi:GLPGLI family protein
MKKTNLFLLLFVSFALNTFAQEVQLVDTTKWLCTYNYELMQDSADRHSVKNVQMYLQIGSHLSKFQSLSKYISDSIFYVYGNKGTDPQNLINAVSKSMSTAMFNIMAAYNIFKNFPRMGSMIFTDYDDHKFLKVEQLMNMDWRLDDQKDSVILGYSCQKAYISYAGRDYIAWYSLQVPINEGPYKFNGLPGLILKISDSKNQHCFTLTSIKKMTYIQPITYILNNFTDIKAEEYIKIMKTKMIRLFGTVQNGLISLPNEEAKARSLNGLRSKNNFLEKF